MILQFPLYIERLELIELYLLERYVYMEEKVREREREREARELWENGRGIWEFLKSGDCGGLYVGEDRTVCQRFQNICQLITTPLRGTP